MALSIRMQIYNGKPGFLICGRDPLGRQVRIFTETLVSAEHILDKVKRGEEINVPDFHYGDDS